MDRGFDAFTGSLEDCYRLHADYVRNVAGRRIVGDSDLVDDACAFAWMRAAECWPVGPNAIGWLILTARRHAWRMQANRRGRDVAEVVPSVEPVARDLAEEVEQRAALAALADLSRNQRLALTGRAIGLSYAEIAAATGHQWTWANRHVTKGRAALRAALADTEE